MEQRTHEEMEQRIRVLERELADFRPDEKDLPKEDEGLIGLIERRTDELEVKLKDLKEANRALITWLKKKELKRKVWKATL